MTEAGWLAGWLPRVLQPFAPTYLRKRKTLRPLETDGDLHPPLPSGKGEPSKKQRRGPPARARDKQVPQATHQLAHCRPQRQPSRDKQRSQPPQQPRQEENGLQSSQPRIAPIGGLSRGGRESDASFTSVPSDEEARKAANSCPGHRNFCGALRTSRSYQPQLTAAGPALHAQQQPRRHQQQQQQQQRHQVPPLPLHQLQQNQQQRAFPSLLPPPDLHLERSAASGPKRRTAGDGSVAAAGTATAGAAVATASGCLGASSLRFSGSISGRSAFAKVSAGVVGFASSSGSPCVNTFVSVSTSALPLLPPLSPFSPLKSRSTSALPSLALAAQPPAGAPAATRVKIHEGTRQQEVQQLRQQQEKLPQPQGKRLQQGGKSFPSGTGPFHLRNPYGTAAASSSSSGGRLLGVTREPLGPPSPLLPEKPLPPKQKPHRVGPLGKESPSAAPTRLGAAEEWQLGRPGPLVSAEVAEALFASPKKDEDGGPLSQDVGLVFGHRVLRPLVSKDPAENYDAFLDILGHAKKHCEAETLELLREDKELLYYTRGNYHPKTALRQQEQQQQQQQSEQQQQMAGARPAWALPAALLVSLNAQKSVDPFSVFGDAPTELLLHEVYGQQHYNALSRNTRATHPVLSKLEKFSLLPRTASNSSTQQQQQQHYGVAATVRRGGENRFITAEMWKDVLLPALLSWWRQDSAVELDWRHDPLTAEDCCWYLQAMGATQDLTDLVTLKQPCFCPTPNPQRGWSWTDSRQLLRQRLAAGSSPARRGRLSPWLSPSPPKRRIREKAARRQPPFSSPLHRTSAFAAARLHAAAAPAAVVSPITPGVRRRRQRKWAEASGALTGQSATRKKIRSFSPSGWSTGLPVASPRPPSASAAAAARATAAMAATLPTAAAATPPLLSKGESLLNGELGRMLADAQRRLNSLADRMRSSRRAQSAAGTAAAAASRPQISSSMNSSSSSLRSRQSGSNTRALSASESFLQGVARPLGGVEGERANSSSSLMQLTTRAQQRQKSLRQLSAQGGRLIQSDSSTATGASYYSSSNLPLLGRERGFTQLPAAGALKAPSACTGEGANREDATAMKTLNVQGAANGFRQMSRHLREERLFAEGLRPDMFPSHAAIWKGK